MSETKTIRCVTCGDTRAEPEWGNNSFTCQDCMHFGDTEPTRFAWMMRVIDFKIEEAAQKQETSDYTTEYG